VALKWLVPLHPCSFHRQCWCIKAIAGWCLAYDNLTVSDGETLNKAPMILLFTFFLQRTLILLKMAQKGTFENVRGI